MDVRLTMKRVHRTLHERIMRAQYTTYAPLKVEIWKVPDEADGSGVVGEPVKEPAEAFEKFEIGDSWGKAWQTVWFRFSGRTPETGDVTDGDTVEAVINLGWEEHSPGFQSEGLVRDSDGRTIKALNPRNQWVPLPQTPGTEFEFSVEAAANPLLLGVLAFQPTEDGDKLTAAQENIYRLIQADVVIKHTDVVELALDISVLWELLDAKGEERFTNDDFETLIALNSALDHLDLHNVSGTATKAREVLRPIFERSAFPGAHRMSAVGHAHIDSAWLWPLRETKRKVNRTLANVVRLIEDGTGLIFALPAAQHVAWLKDEDPELFERVQRCVAEGSIVPVGSMWVEMDAMLPGGESMARQLVEGTAFFEEAFGVAPREIWLPDSFGYSAAIPQLAREAGIDRFLTQKISWNQTNKFPHHTLLWEGLDGSRVFTHFPPADTYGSEVTGHQVNHAVENFKNKGESNISLLPFGYGDGGGGPTREMMERIDRFGSLRGAPHVVSESPHTFFERAEAEYPTPPVWVGELYLELHRGTLTSQIRAKQCNRRSEALLREAELWNTVAALRGYRYPYDELREAWRKVLLCQFHDILPGTSVAWVYREVAQLYAEVKDTCERIISQAIDFLAKGADGGGEGSDAPTFANATSFPVDGISALGAGFVNKLHDKPASDLTTSEFAMSNGLLSLNFEASGELEQLTDAAGHTYIPEGTAAGVFSVFQDFPNLWDAWDIDPFYKGSEEKLQLTFDGITVVDDVATARSYTSLGSSHVVIEWRLPAGEAYVDVHVKVDWHEQEKLLKLGFPVDIHTDRAQYETQFGYLTRPTTTNTSWEEAKFEVSAQKWVRVANEGAALAIANNATYGWDITRHSAGRRGTYSLIRATLVKSAVFPDPHQDQGEFEWDFRIHPSASIADAIADGQQLNIPLREVPVAIAAPFACEGAVVESVSMAPDRSGDVVIRLYEGTGSPSMARITWPNASVHATDLLYRDSDSAPEVISTDGVHMITLAPFQIVTLRVRVNTR